MILSHELSTSPSLLDATHSLTHSLDKSFYESVSVGERRG